MERLYPGRKFTPDGHLVGSIGELIAAERFGLTLHGMSKPGQDAFDADDNQVQIKLTAGNSVSMFADCERLVSVWSCYGSYRRRKPSYPRWPRRSGMGGCWLDAKERPAQDQSEEAAWNCC